MIARIARVGGRGRVDRHREAAVRPFGQRLGGDGLVLLLMRLLTLISSLLLRILILTLVLLLMLLLMLLLLILLMLEACERRRALKVARGQCERGRAAAQRATPGAQQIERLG